MSLSNLNLNFLLYPKRKRITNQTISACSLRTEILDSALLAFDKMIDDDKAGIKPLFRDREWNKEERSKSKKDRKVNWYKTGNKDIEYKYILFVPVTKGSKLAK
jgi:hypothetical protein